MAAPANSSTGGGAPVSAPTSGGDPNETGPQAGQGPGSRQQSSPFRSPVRHVSPGQLRTTPERERRSIIGSSGARARTPEERSSRQIGPGRRKQRRAENDRLVSVAGLRALGLSAVDPRAVPAATAPVFTSAFAALQRPENDEVREAFLAGKDVQSSASRRSRPKQQPPSRKSDVGLGDWVMLNSSSNRTRTKP